MKVIETKRPEEIKSILQDAMDNQKQFVVWQRDKDANILFQIKAILENVMQENIYEFKLESDVSLNPELPVFFAVVDSSLVFKTVNVKNANSTLVLNTPYEVKYKDRRAHPRKTFKYQDKKYVEVIYTLISADGNQERFQSEIIDISEGGLCIAITQEAYDKLDKSKLLNLKSMNSDIALNSDYAKVMNSRHLRGSTLSKGNTLAIGLMFVLKTPEKAESF